MYRADAQDDLAHDVDRREVVGVDRAMALGAGGEEELCVTLGDVELDRKAPRRPADTTPVSAAAPDCMHLALPLRPDDRIHLGLDDAAGIGVECEFRLVAGLDQLQLVLRVQRDDLVGLLDETSSPARPETPSRTNPAAAAR